MSKKDELKSLVNSVNMVKNMVESIVAAVQDRFKDYDNVVVSLKERIEQLENQSTGTGQAVPADLSSKFDMLEKRMDSLNERLLLIEASKSVHAEPSVEATDVQAIKETAEREIKVETELLPEAPSTPAPAPSVVELEPVAKTEVPSIPPSVEAPSTPPPAPAAVPMPQEEAVEEPVAQPEAAEVPAAEPTPSVQISESVERDVSPISKEVSGTIPMPPKQEEAAIEPVQPQVPKTEEVDPKAPEEGKSAELFGEAVSGDKAELLKALKKLEDL